MLSRIAGFFAIVGLLSTVVGVTAFFASDITLYQIVSKLTERGVLEPPPVQRQTEVATSVRKTFFEPRIEVPQSYRRINVNNADELLGALKQAALSNGNAAILLASGVYELQKTVYVQHDNIMVMSETGDPYDVVIKGGSGNLFRVAANHFYLDGVTLAEARNHLIQIAGESNASYPIINNCILQDAYEQFIKVSYNKHTPENTSVGGVVKNSIFQFTRGVAQNYYTGGIDALGAEGWLVEKNVFRDIASPSGHIAQHAVHFWVNSAHNRVIGNLFVDVDRAIGFGMPLPQNSAVLKYSHHGGEIAENVIYHSDNGDPFGDTAIILESASDASVHNNIVFMEHWYPNAIEYRFETSVGLRIFANRVNKSIAARTGAKATLAENSERLSQQGFLAEFNAIMDRLGIETLHESIVQSAVAE
ncbi:right-handed parallel beta-helix repeat-containing protein [Alteromonas aestuariivivens]|uniref:Right-handed parallel beta-helix repeat-containing protein n=1 Tax=Alteromonas aestuariivivens TaxID=1938339 RepID=A0A3D8MF50_9ALTE|nr:right-handed parallel beta-helix repeat-containing protein [Alteromonas aestuariivivens]RDV29191.1 right-handed parallel beta-helix repeat-containing protein [Alteromonas aestuariivivens]